ncbi:MAG TPA: protein kinase [Gammaproteobacteria bacterium]|nr:protein kinase [Gammaproteobacteria bacterium]
MTLECDLAKQWLLAEEYFNKNPNAKKLDRKISFPVFVGDLITQFYIVKGKVTQAEIDKMHKGDFVELLQHSFIKTKEGEIFALVAGKSLGEGTYAKVKIGIKKSGEKVAVKIQSGDHSEKIHKNEIMILELLHRYIGQSIRVLRFPKKWLNKGFITTKLYLLQKLAEGRELFDILKEYETRSEDIPNPLALQMSVAACLCVKTLHNKLIIHGDLKPENYIVHLTETGVDINLVDFGFSSILDDEDGCVHKLSGSPGYAAPEVMQFVKDIAGNLCYDSFDNPIPLSGEGKQYLSSDIYSLGRTLELMVPELPIIKQMVNTGKENRPNIDTVIDSLANTLSRLELTPKVELPVSPSNITTTKTEVTFSQLDKKSKKLIVEWLYNNSCDPSDYVVKKDSSGYSIVLQRRIFTVFREDKKKELKGVEKLEKKLKEFKMSKLLSFTPLYDGTKKQAELSGNALQYILDEVAPRARC